MTDLSNPGSESGCLKSLSVSQQEHCQVRDFERPVSLNWERLSQLIRAAFFKNETVIGKNLIGDANYFHPVEERTLKVKQGFIAPRILINKL